MPKLGRREYRLAGAVDPAWRLGPNRATPCWRGPPPSVRSSGNCLTPRLRGTYRIMRRGVGSEGCARVDGPPETDPQGAGAAGHGRGARVASACSRACWGAIGSPTSGAPGTGRVRFGVPVRLFSGCKHPAGAPTRRGAVQSPCAGRRQQPPPIGQWLTRYAPRRGCESEKGKRNERSWVVPRG
jgi:hypothetical protein